MAATTQPVLFKFGTRAEYNSLQTKQDNALYFLTDTGELLRGNVNLAQGRYFNGTLESSETKEAAITRIVGSAPLVKNDICIIKEQIVEGKDELTAFVYDGENWQAINGNYNAKSVYFDEDFTITKETEGNSASELVAIPARGLNVKEVFQTVFTKTINLQDEVKSVKSNLLENYYTKTELAGALRYRGTAASKDEIIQKTDPAPIAGDIWIASDTNTEYIYNGTDWEELGRDVDLTNFETRIGNLETTVGKPAEIDESGLVTVPATGLYKEIPDIVNTAVNNLEIIKGITINGEDLPIVEQKVSLFDFTNENVNKFGLVPVPSTEIKTSDDTYVLDAKGNWVIPFDKRIGTLTYNGTTYTTVTDYVDARTAEMSMTWQTITD